MLLLNKHASKLVQYSNKFRSNNYNNYITPAPPQVLSWLNHQSKPTTTTINTTIRKYHSNFIANSSSIDNMMNQNDDSTSKVFREAATSLNSSTDSHVSTTTTNKVNYFPIGESNFESIIRNGQFYIDKTHCIPAVEKQLTHPKITITYSNGDTNDHPNELVLARPNGWGKSTFLSMLHCYYDINKKDEFNTIFGNLYIGNNYTINRNTYHVMKFDFSNAKSNFTTLEQFNHEINSIIKNSLLQFIDYYQLNSALNSLNTNSPNYIKYHSYIDRSEETIANIQLFYHIYNYLNLNKSSNKLLILVDEFDKQVNELILENPNLYASFITCSPLYDKRLLNKIYDPLEGLFEQFYYITTNDSVEIHQCYVNTTPIYFSYDKYKSRKALANWDDEFEDCMGFTIDEVKQHALNNYKLNDEILDKLIANYGNYYFRVSTPLLNPSLVLRVFNGEDPIQQQINSNKYEKLLDHIENLHEIDLKRVVIQVQGVINFNGFVEYDHWTTIHYIFYLIFQGLLSIKGIKQFDKWQYGKEEYFIPNQFAKQSLGERHYQKLLLILASACKH